MDSCSVVDFPKSEADMLALTAVNRPTIMVLYGLLPVSGSMARRRCERALAEMCRLPEPERLDLDDIVLLARMSQDVPRLIDEELANSQADADEDPWLSRLLRAYSTPAARDEVGGEERLDVVALRARLQRANRRTQ